MTSTAAITSSAPAAIHAAPTTADVHAVPIQATVTAQVVGSLRLRIVVGTSSYNIAMKDLTPAQQAKVTELQNRLITGENREAVIGTSLNLDDCIMTRDGVSTYLPSSHPLITDFRAFVKEILGVKALLWKTYLPGERTHTDAGKEKQYTNARLTELKPDPSDRIRSLHETSLTDSNPIGVKEQMKRLVREKAAEHLLQITLAGLKKIKDNLPAGELASQGRAQKIEEAIKTVQGLKRTAILFEATHPLDLSVLDPTKRMDALKKKRDCAQALLNSREAPTTWGGLKSDINPEEEQDYSAQFALNTYIGIRDGYDAACLELKGEPTRDPLEGFFMRLSAEVADGRPLEALNDRLFNRLFEALNASERTQLRTFLTTEAQRLSAAFQQLPPEGPDAALYNYRPGTTWATLGKSQFQDALPNAFDREIARLLRPQA